MNPIQVARLVKEKRILSVRVGGADADGVYRGKRFSAEAFVRGMEQGFPVSDAILSRDVAGALVEDSESTGWHTGFPDVALKPDLATFAAVPWEEGTASVIADFVQPDGRAIELSAREVLRRITAEVRRAGFSPQAACEPQVRILRETPATLREKRWRDLSPVSPGGSVLGLAGASADEFIVGKIRRMMDAYGIPLDASVRSEGDGVYDFHPRPAEAMHAADRAMLFKAGVKELCRQEGLVATFMAATFPGAQCLAGHVNVSLWDAKGVKNLFAADGRPGKEAKSGQLPEVLRQFVAGVLSTLRDFAALYLPNTASYKRLALSRWAPDNATWGVDNRTCALRVVASHGSPLQARLENRVPGADANGYLGVAAVLAGGLAGIREKLEPPPAVSGSAREAPEKTAARLPRNLLEAADVFEHSEAARKAFGENFVRQYARTRRWEWEQYARTVSSWERERYLETV